MGEERVWSFFLMISTGAQIVVPAVSAIAPATREPRRGIDSKGVFLCRKVEMRLSEKWELKLPWSKAGLLNSSR